MMGFLTYKLTIKKRVEIIPKTIKTLSKKSLLLSKRVTKKIISIPISTKNNITLKKLIPTIVPTKEIKKRKINRKIKNQLIFLIILIKNILSLFNNYTKKGKRWIKI